MIDGGLDASGKVVELERDTAIRSSLYKSPEYLSSVIRTKLQDSNNLAKKQIHLSHLKLQKGLLSSQDVLALDTLLNTVTDEARFKIIVGTIMAELKYTMLYKYTRYMVQVYFETSDSHWKKKEALKLFIWQHFYQKLTREGEMFFYYNHLLQKPLTIQSIKGTVLKWLTP